MGFIAKGNKIVLKPGSGSTQSSLLYKRMTQSGAFNDVTWGSSSSDFETPITSSTWTTYGSYKYLNIGLVRQIYNETHEFNRNTIFDSKIRVSNEVTPAGTDISGIAYITALVRGSMTDDASTLCQRLIDEFSAGAYDYVLAIGKMNQDIDDYRAINIDVNNIKTFMGSAKSTKDYTLPTTEAVYLVNIALGPNILFNSITSLSVSIYQQEFIEFFGDNFIAPGSVGKTEINPDYKAEKAINNYMITVDDDHIVDNTIIISPDYTTQLDEGTIYYLNYTSSNSATHISLGYYDTDDDTYVASGKLYPLTASGTIAGKICVAVLVNGEFTIKALV